MFGELTVKSERLTTFSRAVSIFTLCGLGVVWNNLAVAHEGHNDDEGGHLIQHQVDGIHVDGGLTWFLQGTDGLANDTAALTYSFDLGLEAPIGKHGKAVVALEGGEGTGVDDVIGSLSAVNYDAFFSELTSNVGGATNVVVPSISQAYYEGDYDNLVVSVGKLDVHSMYDENAYANDETDQFMSAIFTRSPGTSYAELDYYYAPGLVAQYAASDMLDVTLGVANGNESGFQNVFDRMYSVAEINIKPGLIDLDGNYRFYYINDGRHYTDISDGSNTANKAWGLSFDQALPGGTGVFARYSQQDDNIVENTVKSAWSLGALFGASAWGRDEDTIGIGYGSVNVNKDPAALVAAGITNPDDEIHVEAFYKYTFSDHFTLTADLQRVTNSGGTRDAAAVTVAGLRGQMNF
jgi:hypothetical protein